MACLLKSSNHFNTKNIQIECLNGYVELGLFIMFFKLVTFLFTTFVNIEQQQLVVKCFLTIFALFLA